MKFRAQHISAYIIFLLHCNNSFGIESEYYLDNAILEKLKSYQIEVHNPSNSLNYGYSNSRIPMSDYARGNISSLGDEFTIENSIMDVNNKPNQKLILDIQNHILNRIRDDKKILMAYLGYHDVIPAYAKEISSTNLKNLPFVKEYTFSGRYQQKFKAICGFSSGRKGLIILFPGRGGHINAYWGLGAPDYSSSAAKVYFNSLDVNVCAVSIFTLPDIALKRYGLTAMGVNISIISDFIYWVETNKDINRSQPIILGGVSNGGHAAEYAALLLDNVKGVISSGAAARYHYPLSQYSEIKLNPKNIKLQNGPYTPLNQALRSWGVFKLLTNKMLLVSIGTHDAGIVNKGPDKFDQLHYTKQAFQKAGNKNCIGINLFYGNHAMEPEGEVNEIKKLFRECLALRQ